MQKTCVHCDCPMDIEDLADGLINGKQELCESCKDPRTCENGNNGDRCRGCAQHLYEMSHDL